ncbi:MAG: hypothetical protein Q9182_002583 [Xanthomendoza sp. 2 TL-2023]
MFPSFPFSLFLLSSSQLISHAWALPANPISDNADQQSSLQPDGPEQNLTASTQPRLPIQRLPSATAPILRLGSRPKDGYIFPTTKSGSFFVRINHFGDHLNGEDGRLSLDTALAEINGWITHSKKGSHTPVADEHHWTHGQARLTIRPHDHGYLLGDLAKYVSLLETLHVQAGEYWEWDGLLLHRTSFFGFLTTVGKAGLRRVG